jgi:UDP-glucose 4-epimerase
VDYHNILNHLAEEGFEGEELSLRALTTLLHASHQATGESSASGPSISINQRPREHGEVSRGTNHAHRTLGSTLRYRGGHSDRGRVLVTGGCGYIGSHTIVSLLEMGYDVTVVDSLVNSCEESLSRVLEISGCDKRRIKFFKVDLRDYKQLERVFRSSPQFAACIHFAGLKAVGESTQVPLEYYENNLGGTTNLLKLMDKYGCHNIVFSSSATVYGSNAVSPLTESSPVGSGITNAYGRSKFMIEEILQDFKDSKASNKDREDTWGIVVLRYFNPVGAHPSGLIGEDPNGIPNNLMPYVAQTAVGRRDKVTIFGGDYPTHDGTGVRDYIHVVDLAEGHTAALAYLDKKGPGFYRFNLGTGKGLSVLDMVRAMSKACGHEIKYEIGPRRPGDVAEVYADTTLAEQELGWKATRTQEDMCNDIWRWQSNNPDGFATKKSDKR